MLKKGAKAYALKKAAPYVADELGMKQEAAVMRYMEEEKMKNGKKLKDRTMQFLNQIIKNR